MFNHKAMRFTVIGISDSHIQHFAPDVFALIGKSRVFSGGKRHHEIMKRYLPDGYEWIDVTAPLENVYSQYIGHKAITVFVSGDPLFYGFGSTLMRKFPVAEIKMYPSFNSLQLLAHRLNMPYQSMTNVSVTGRPWDMLDSSLISGNPIIGILTDKKKTPAMIAERMLEYGYDNYEMSIGENLGNELRERVSTIPLNRAIDMDFEMPNCVILRMTHPRIRRFGIPDREFSHLAGRERMITKMPVRLLSLSMLDLHNHKSLWDIGFCTGSVSIEAKLQFPHLSVTAYERRPESATLITENAKRFGTPGITSVTGDFFDIDLSLYPAPDAVFIGGHGGRLPEMLERITKYAPKDCIIVFNSVNRESYDTFIRTAESLGKRIVGSHRVTLDEFNPITVIKAK